MIGLPRRASGASTRLLRKGVLLNETYQVMAGWDNAFDVRDNLRRVRETNSIGAPNTAWLREVIRTLSSRFRSPAVVEPLAFLAKVRLPLAEWRWFLLWRTQITDLLFFHFVTDWLFPRFEKGIHNMRAEQVGPFFLELVTELAGETKEISEYGVLRGGRDLMLMAADFGLIEGNQSRNFTPTHVPESAFLWALHDLHSRTPNAYRLIHDPSWRLFLLSPAAVEREILHLHQFKRLDYQTAGSLSQLKLPYSDPMAYLRSIDHE